LLYVDLRELEFNIVDIPSLESCKVCGPNPDGAPLAVADRFFEETCARDGRRNFVTSPVKRIDLNMEQLGAVLKKKGLQIESSGSLGITFKKSEQLKACILKSGIMIAQTPPQMESSFKDEVLETYRSILVEGMGLPETVVPDV
jgi:hypothetical protein